MPADDQVAEIAQAGGDRVDAQQQLTDSAVLTAVGIWVGAYSASRANRLTDKLSRFEERVVLIRSP